jgi:hypothetical protein
MQNHLAKTPSEDRIRAIAHALWLEEGQPDGRADAHWAMANDLAAREESNVDAHKPKRKPVAKKSKAKA